MFFVGVNCLIEVKLVVFPLTDLLDHVLPLLLEAVAVHGQGYEDVEG